MSQLGTRNRDLVNPPVSWMLNHEQTGVGDVSNVRRGRMADGSGAVDALERHSLDGDEVFAV